MYSPVNLLCSFHSTYFHRSLTLFPTHNIYIIILHVRFSILKLLIHEMIQLCLQMTLCVITKVVCNFHDHRKFLDLHLVLHLISQVLISIGGIVFISWAWPALINQRSFRCCSWSTCDVWNLKDTTLEFKARWML